MSTPCPQRKSISSTECKYVPRHDISELLILCAGSNDKHFLKMRKKSTYYFLSTMRAEGVRANMSLEK